MCSNPLPLDLAVVVAHLCAWAVSIAAAAVGDELILLGSVLKYGRAMGFTEVTIRQLPDGVREAVARESSPQRIGALVLDAPVVAIGRHTKVFPSK